MHARCRPLLRHWRALLREPSGVSPVSGVHSVERWAHQIAGNRRLAAANRGGAFARDGAAHADPPRGASSVAYDFHVARAKRFYDGAVGHDARVGPRTNGHDVLRRAAVGAREAIDGHVARGTRACAGARPRARTRVREPRERERLVGEVRRALMVPLSYVADSGVVVRPWFRDTGLPDVAFTVHGPKAAAHIDRGEK